MMNSGGSKVGDTLTAAARLLQDNGDHNNTTLPVIKIQTDATTSNRRRCMGEAKRFLLLSSSLFSGLDDTELSQVA